MHQCSVWSFSVRTQVLVPSEYTLLTLCFSVIDTTSVPTVTTTPIPSGSSGNTKAVIIGCVVGFVVFIVIITILLWKMRARDRLRRFTFHRDMMIRRGDSDSSNVALASSEPSSVYQNATTNASYADTVQSLPFSRARRDSDVIPSPIEMHSLRT